MASIVFISALIATVVSKPLPFPTPPPDDQGETSPSQPGCTTVLTSSIRGFNGNWTPFIEETVYTATDTIYHRVPCNGCVISITTELVKPWGGVGPMEQVTATVTAAKPFRTTKTICSITSTPVHPAIPRGALMGDVDAGSAPVENVAVPKPRDVNTNNPACTFTQPVPLKPTFGPTQTLWTTTKTHTSHVDCKGCMHVATSTLNFLNHGPVVHFTATETAKTPTTSTIYVCLKTPSVTGSTPTMKPRP